MQSIILAAALLVGPAGVDPLTAEVELGDAERFAALYEKHDGTLSAEVLQRDYIDQGGKAIEIFTPGRIYDGERMEEIIAREPATYRDAVTRCLPWAREATPQLRSIYLGLAGLLPDAELPRISVVIGGDNSGGTAGLGMQVLGLEVLCRLSEDRAAFDQLLRKFFAHETVHTWQDLGAAQRVDPFLAAALSEGTADYIAMLVTGEAPDTERDTWATENAALVWSEWAKDAAIISQNVGPDGPNEVAGERFFRWFGNAGSPPEGWPSELGYWIGRQIVAGYVAQADDKRAAIEGLLTAKDPVAILEASGLDYRGPE